MSQKQSTEREPCPWRIIEDSGGAFAFGLVGGSLWHFVGGARNAPAGMRISQAIGRVKARTPLLGGSFAVWGMLFSSIECVISSARRKEDPWNGILSGAATGGLLAARAGLKAAGKNAVMGGVILAAIEGLGVLVERLVTPMIEETAQTAGRPVDFLDPPVDPLKPYRPPIRNLMAKAFNNAPLGMGSMPLGLGGADTGGVSTTHADEFDFTTGRYKSELQAASSEEAVNNKEAEVQAVEDKKKGWW